MLFLLLLFNVLTVFFGKAVSVALVERAKFYPLASSKMYSAFIAYYVNFCSGLFWVCCGFSIHLKWVFIQFLVRRWAGLIA